MKATLWYATLSLALSSQAFAKSELELLRDRCTEQERQIQRLEDENARLKSPKESSEKPETRAMADKPSAATYTVRAGDTLEKISRRTGNSVATLGKLNKITPSTVIHPGQTLKLAGGAKSETATVSTPSPSTTATTPSAPSAPSGATHTVQKGDTFYSIARKHGITTEALSAANPGVKPTALQNGQSLQLPKNASAPAKTEAPNNTRVISNPAKPTAEPAAKTVSNTPKAPAPTPKTETAKQEPKRETKPEAPKSEPAKQESKPAPAPSLASSGGGDNVAKPVVRSIILDSQTTYGEFADKYGTTAERLNHLNGLSLGTNTLLAKGSELYIPAQP